MLGAWNNISETDSITDTTLLRRYVKALVKLSKKKNITITTREKGGERPVGLQHFYRKKLRLSSGIQIRKFKDIILPLRHKTLIPPSK